MAATRSRNNSVLLQSNINNTRSDVAQLIRVLVEIARRIESRLASGGEAERAAFEARVKSLSLVAEAQRSKLAIVAV